MSNDWSNGICGCFADCSTCICSFFCPCIQFGRNAEVMGESCIQYGIAHLVPLLGLYCRITTRGKIRDQKNIEGSCLKDILCTLFCTPCALAQESQELGPPKSSELSRE